MDGETVSSFDDQDDNRKSKKFTRDVGTFVMNEKKNRFAFELLVKNQPGAIFVIGQEFAEKNVNILHFAHSDTQSDKAAVFVVGDFSSADCSPEELLEHLKNNTDFVLEAEFAKKAGPVYYSSYLFPLQVDGKRTILFGPANLNGFLYGLRKNLGDGMALSLLYHMGFGIGEYIYNYYIKTKGYTFRNIDKIMEMVNAILVSYGWGKVSNFSLGGNRIIIDVEDLWECEIQKENGDATGSNYFRGILAGFFQRVYEKNVEVKETLCIAKGDDFCQFEVHILD